MKQCPSRLKYRKNHRVNSSFFSLKDNKSFFSLNGQFALKSLESGKLTYKQIEAGRKTIRRNVRKFGDIWIRVFPSKSITKKPVATRMGKGKGAHNLWMCTVRAGQVIYEVCGVSSWNSIKALKRASNKLPFKTKIFKLSY